MPKPREPETDALSDARGLAAERLQRLTSLKAEEDEAKSAFDASVGTPSNVAAGERWLTLREAGERAEKESRAADARLATLEREAVEREQRPHRDKAVREAEALLDDLATTRQAIEALRAASTRVLDRRSAIVEALRAGGHPGASAVSGDAFHEVPFSIIGVLAVVFPDAMRAERAMAMTALDRLGARVLRAVKEG